MAGHGDTGHGDRGDGSAYDDGAQPERTTLAWRRTALSLAVAVAVGAKALFPLFGPLGLAASAGGVAVAVGLWMSGSRRYDQARRCVDGGPPNRLPGGLPLLLAAAMATLAGAAALLFVLG